MKPSTGIPVYLLFVIALLVSVSSSEKLTNEPKLENSITILPGKLYYGVRMNTSLPLIIKVDKKRLVDGRYQLECFSAGPDPQGELKVIPLVSSEVTSGPSTSQSRRDVLLNKMLPNSLLSVNGELYNSKNSGENFVAFQVVAKLKNVSYSKQIQAKDILLNIELEFFEFGLPRLFFHVVGSILLSTVLTLIAYLACTRLRLVDRLSRFIFDHKTYKNE